MVARHLHLPLPYAEIADLVELWHYGATAWSVVCTLPTYLVLRIADLSLESQHRFKATVHTVWRLASMLHSTALHLKVMPYPESRVSMQCLPAAS